MSQDEQERTEDLTPSEQEQPAPEVPSVADPVLDPSALEGPDVAEAALEQPVPEGLASDATDEERPLPADERPTEARPRRDHEDDRPDRSRNETGDRRRRFFGRRKVCSFCVEKVRTIDYKDAVKLRRYLSDRGRIEARRKTGTCAKHQRWLALALKRARHLALLPYTPEHIRESGMFFSRR